MDLDPEALRLQIENLTYQASMERWQSSRSIKAIKDFIEQNEPTDPLIHPPDKKNNPWIDRSKCIVF